MRFLYFFLRALLRKLAGYDMVSPYRAADLPESEYDRRARHAKEMKERRALAWCGTGHYNTAIGYNALCRVTSGQENTLVGIGAGYAIGPPAAKRIAPPLQNERLECALE